MRLLKNRPHLNILQTSLYPIYKQLQVEEALLRADRQNWCLINRGSPSAIVMGISGKPELLIQREQMEKAPLPLIRRFSGGGTVVVDEATLFVTFICNDDTVEVCGCPQKILHWTGQLYAPLFQQHPFSVKENDYAIGERKCGGNAQYLCKERWLHHTSFLWNYAEEKMHYLKMPPRMPSYRQGRPHSDFLCRLADLFPTQDFLIDKLLERLGDHFQLKNHSLEKVERSLLSLPHRKATTLVDYC
jgi:lipoate-protein ligase A